MIRKICLFIIWGLIAVAPVRAAVLTVTPSTQEVNVGGTFTFDLQVSGLGGGTSLGVYDIDLGFDPALLSFSTLVFGPGLDVLGLGSLQAVTAGTGAVNLFELSLDSVTDLTALQPSAFTLASLTFSALSPGNGLLSLTVNALGDANGDALLASVQGAQFTVAAPVPEPATYSMMIAGLCILGFFIRRGRPADSDAFRLAPRQM